MNWDNIKHFSRDEPGIGSPDVPGSGDNMQQAFMEKLDDAREECGFPFFINSGFRTYDHNRMVGGATGSSHLRGWAADVRCVDLERRHKLLQVAFELGFRQIFLGSTFIHLGDDPDHAVVCGIYVPGSHSRVM